MSSNPNPSSSFQGEAPGPTNAAAAATDGAAAVDGRYDDGDGHYDGDTADDTGGYFTGDDTTYGGGDGDDTTAHTRGTAATMDGGVGYDDEEDPAAGRRNEDGDDGDETTDDEYDYDYENDGYGQQGEGDGYDQRGEGDDGYDQGGVGEQYDARRPEGDGYDDGYDDEYRGDDGYDGDGVGEQYDARRPDHNRASYSMGGPSPMGPGQYNDYDYENNSFYSKHDDDEQNDDEQQPNDDDDDGNEEDAERVPLRPSVRNYDHFDRDAEFQDEYDSDEDDNEQGGGPSFYNRGREQYEYRNDEADEERRVTKKRKINFKDETVGKKIVAAVCCCCICLITILLLVLFLLVFNENEIRANGRDRGKDTGNTPRPTPRPTYPIPPALRPATSGGGEFQPWIRVTDAPTISSNPTGVASSGPTLEPTGMPTPKPTISPAPTRPVPPTITLDAVADTYVYVDGFHQFESYGSEDSFLVQNGLAEYYEFGDALGLVLFDLSTLPTRIQMSNYDAQAILRLNHLDVNEKFGTRDPAVISIRKLESTAMRIETLHGGMVSADPEDSILGQNDFTVGLTQDRVYVDISDLLYPANFTTDGYDKKELLLMIFNNSTEQGDPRWTEVEWQDQAGDRFKSIESGDGPSLTITYVPR